MDAVGRQLGCFELKRVLGSGASGTVYLAHHQVIKSEVAVKVLHPSLCTKDSVVRACFNQARGVNLIGCENIIRIYDMGKTQGGDCYLAMEHLAGSALAVNEAPSLEEAEAVLDPVMDALSAAHEAGFAHRDLKPDNIRFVSAEGRRCAKLLDFGMAELFDPDPPEATRPTRPITPFCAPEQVLPAKASDQRADVYALGVILFWIATGRFPYGEAELAEATSEGRFPPPPRPVGAKGPVHPAHEAMLLRAIAHDPEARYQTIRDLRAGLELATAIAKRDRTPSKGTKVALEPAKPSSIETLDVVGMRPRTLGEAVNGRRRADYEVQLEIRDLASFRRMYAMDIAHHGMFIATSGALPPLQALVDVMIGGAGEGMEIVLHGRVVRHVTARDAQSFGGRQGMAIQLLDLDAKKKSDIERVIYGTPGRPDRKDRVTEKNPKAEKVIERFAALGSNPGPYHLLQILPGAPAETIRETVHRLSRDTDPEALGPMTDDELDRLSDIRQRIEKAGALLLDPRSRAAHDGATGNYQGVAQALASGLLVEELKSLRRQFLATRWDAAEAARAHVREAMRSEYEGRLSEARTKLEWALHLDPLDLEVHNLYWALRHKMEQPKSAQS